MEFYSLRQQQEQCSNDLKYVEDLLIQTLAENTLPMMHIQDESTQGTYLGILQKFETKKTDPFLQQTIQNYQQIPSQSPNNPDPSLEQDHPVSIPPETTQDLPEISQTEQNWSSSIPSRQHKTRKIYKSRGGQERKEKNPKKPTKGYPTNNLMPAVRRMLIDYLQQFFTPSYFKQIPIIKQIKSKAEITLKDFEEFLNEKQFRRYLKQYFASRAIYRDLMSSRVKPEQKKIYLRRIHIFQEGFKTGQFKSIN